MKQLLIIPISIILIVSIFTLLPLKSNAVNPIQHVIVIPEENFPLQWINSTSAPYLTGLENQYASTLNYTGIVCCDSGKEYFALTSGTEPNADQQAGTFNERNIGDLVNWKEYAESIPYSCDPNSGLPEGSQPYDLYLASHNPFPYYSDVWSNQSYCKSHVVSFQNSTNGFLHDLNNGLLPAFSFITPNGCDDMHNWVSNCWQWCPSPSPDQCTNQTQILNGDQWLHYLIPQIQASSYWSSTAIFITFDDNANTNFPGDQVVGTWISPYSNMGFVSTVHYNHYNALSTFESLLGLGNLGTNDSLANPMLDMFNFSQVSSSTTSTSSSSSTISTTASTIQTGNLNVTVSGAGTRSVLVTVGTLPSQNIVPPAKSAFFTNLHVGQTYSVSAKISTGHVQTKSITIVQGNQSLNFAF